MCMTCYSRTDGLIWPRMHEHPCMPACLPTGHATMQGLQSRLHKSRAELTARRTEVAKHHMDERVHT